MTREILIGDAAALVENASIKFVIPTHKYDREGLAVRRGGKVFAYYNECAHIPLPLDWGDGDFFSKDFSRLVCKNHGAEFVPETGECTLGPCTGAELKKIPVILKDGKLYALVEDFL